MTHGETTPQAPRIAAGWVEDPAEARAFLAWAAEPGDETEEDAALFAELLQAFMILGVLAWVAG